MRTEVLDEETLKAIRRLPLSDNLIEAWRHVEAIGPAATRDLARYDRFYLLIRVLKRHDAVHPWLYARCREVEASTDGFLDLWAREHFKSSIITQAGIIQEIVRDPDITVAIFSHNKAIARGFVAQIKREMEDNETLKALFPAILWADPKRESPGWSIDGGLIVKRKKNKKEATIEGHGLVDGQPTSKHFDLLVYDDVVTLESVSTPEQVKKTTDAWRLSDNLGAKTAEGKMRKWHVGTRYSFADTYQVILEEKLLTPRIYPATGNGLPDGEPVFLSKSELEEKRKTQGPTIFAAQMLQNPAAGNEAMFKKEWLRFTDIRPVTLNIYILCDPASSRKKSSDNTAIAVIGIDATGNKYLLDGYHHKMALKERWESIKGLRKTWKARPGIQRVEVGYERYGMQSDIEYFEERMEADRDSWTITELAWPREGPGSKVDRIQRLQPDFAAGRIYLSAANESETSAQRKMREQGEAYRILSPVKRRDHEGVVYSINQRLLQEFLTYPFSTHDDFLDAMSRVYDMDPTPPIIVDQRLLEPEIYTDGI